MRVLLCTCVQIHNKNASERQYFNTPRLSGYKRGPFTGTNETFWSLKGALLQRVL